MSESASDLEPGILQLATSKVPVCTANPVDALHISYVPTNVKDLCLTPEIARHYVSVIKSVKQGAQVNVCQLDIF